MSTDTDNELQQKVIDEMHWDPSFDEEHIVVGVKDHIVTLNGYVAKFAEKKNAELAAGRVGGVRAVVDNLDVQLPGSWERSDLEIAEAALHAIATHGSLPKKGIKVTVTDGWITLDGEVEWRFQHDWAENSVRPLFGVKGITNKIVVKPKLQITDVQAKIKEALVRNAQIEADNVSVTVSGTRAVLGGHVKSWPEKNQAEDAAWAAPGVTAVVNNIVVVS
ncbi:BON domain-containing protein [Herbaspirillum sp. RV1423]|uniref:BON domain-containing protein n=1 Tax=Herbaspirillum sp. RV1423 TaxID=1443993 RepID=UPI00055327CD|nr:BON domain-containing protein [Herbaspirillum sp. RV1423]